MYRELRVRWGLAGRERETDMGSLRRRGSEKRKRERDDQCAVENDD